MRSDKAVNSPPANKERTFQVHMLVEGIWILRKKAFYNCSLASGLFLIFHQISGSSSYKKTVMAVTVMAVTVMAVTVMAVTVMAVTVMAVTVMAVTVMAVTVMAVTVMAVTVMAVTVLAVEVAILSSELTILDLSVTEPFYTHPISPSPQIRNHIRSYILLAALCPFLIVDYQQSNLASTSITKALAAIAKISRTTEE